MEGVNVDWNKCKTLITEAHKNYIMNHFTYNPATSMRTYRERFFKNNPNATEEDFSSWVMHHMSGNWEDDIIGMTDEQFKYQWPVIYSFIMDYYSEEESNRNGPPSDYP
jgi:hypothetical protein